MGNRRGTTGEGERREGKRRGQSRQGRSKGGDERCQEEDRIKKGSEKTNAMEGNEGKRIGRQRLKKE